MDSSIPDIVFDGNGVCNYCKIFARRLEKYRPGVNDIPARREELLGRVKAVGKGKAYDCVVGVSGGIDSSFALYLAVRNGLRPLAVHLDNGWNSELATYNIASLVKVLGVDLHTHVIDWKENRDMQLSFVKAHVVDIELLMDNAMLAANFRQAARHGVRHVLTGVNVVTEGMPMPPGWTHCKVDVRNIRRIHRRFGHIPIRTHPLVSTLGYAWFSVARGISWIPFLDYFDYDKSHALTVLQREVGYKPYSHKHYESVFTRFYQAYILPRKFGVDKRRVHLSSLVVSGHISRDAALLSCEGSPYPDQEQERQDKTFVLKKLGISESDFADYMAAPPVAHERYGTEVWLFNALKRIGQFWGMDSVGYY